MKLIAICGGTNSGKTTISKKIIELLPNTFLEEPDKLMFKYTDLRQKEIFENLGIEKDPNIIDRDYFFANYENVKIWQKTIEPFVIKDIEEQISEIKNQYEYMLIDWAYLPLSDFFDRCDVKILIKSDDSNREARINSRFNGESNEQYGTNQWKNETLLNRIKFNQKVSDDIREKFDYIIYNNSTLENLYENANKIINEIIKKW